jgi:hypothetical protein
MKVDDKDPTAKRLEALQADNEGDATRTFGHGVEGRANALAFTRAVRGRPPKGNKAIGTSTRSLRFTNDVWDQLEAEASHRMITLHALLRVIVAEFLFTRPTPEALERGPMASRTATKKRAKKSA